MVVSMLLLGKLLWPSFLAWPGFLPVTIEQGEGCARVVHSRPSHCGHSLHRDVDKLWKLLSRNSLLFQHWGKTKCFFQCYVSSQEAADVAGSQGAGQRMLNYIKLLLTSAFP